MRKEAKIVAALIISFFVAQILTRTVFQQSPTLNPSFIASLPSSLTRIAEGLLGQNEAETETATCQDPDGTETYEGTVTLGPHMANNNNPANYKQVRRLYNCESGNENVKTSFIPTQVLYDLLFLKGSVEGITANLNEMKQYGLYPIIRVGSYTGGDNNWIKIGPDDAKIMGQNLALALNEIEGFPQKPIVIFGNEVNLHNEWGGQANAEEFATSTASFIDGMGQGNFKIYFPSLSYGADGTNGITPSQYISEFFAAPGFEGKKLDGYSLNIYGSSYESIQTQYDNQKAPFDENASFFNATPGVVIGEIGPTDNVSIIYDCAPDGPWPPGAKPVFDGFIANPVTPFATTACFSSEKTRLAIAHYDETNPKLIDFAVYGSVQNTGGNQPTNTPVPNNQQPTPTKPPAGGGGGGNGGGGNGGGGNGNGGNGNGNINGQASGTVEIKVHVDTEDGAFFDADEIVVYLEGPTSAGRRFGETLTISGEDGECTSGSGFPYSCAPGTAVWKGADNASGTAAGSYTVRIAELPEGWTAVTDEASGTLAAGETLTLDLVIQKE